MDFVEMPPPIKALYTEFYALLMLLNLYFILPAIFIYKYRNVDYIYFRGWNILLIGTLFYLPSINVYLARLPRYLPLSPYSSLFMFLKECKISFVIISIPTMVPFFLNFLRNGQLVILCYHQQIINHQSSFSFDTISVLDRKFLSFFKHLYTQKFKDHPLFTNSDENRLQLQICKDRGGGGSQGEGGSHGEMAGSIGSSQGSSDTTACSESNSLNHHRLASNEMVGRVNNTALVKSIVLFIFFELCCILIVFSIKRFQDFSFCKRVNVIYVPPTIFVMTYFWIVAPILYYILRNLSDKFGMKFELQLYIISGWVAIALYIYTNLTPNPFLRREVGDIFWFLIWFILNQYLSVVQPLIRTFIHINLARKKKSRKITLPDVLDDPILWEKLERQINSDFASENAQFINEYRELMKRAEGSDVFLFAPNASPLLKKKSATKTANSSSSSSSNSSPNASPTIHFNLFHFFRSRNHPYRHSPPYSASSSSTFSSSSSNVVSYPRYYHHHYGPDHHHHHHRSNAACGGMMGMPVSAEMTHQRIIAIIRKFIIPGSPCELNINWKTGQSIIQKLKDYKEGRSGHLLRPSDLDRVLNEVMHNILANSWPRFLSDNPDSTLFRDLSANIRSPSNSVSSYHQHSSTTTTPTHSNPTSPCPSRPNLELCAEPKVI